MPPVEATPASYSWKRDLLFWAYSVLMLLPIIMVLVFYNYYTFDLLAYAGWILLAFSVVIIFMAGGEFQKKGGAPKGKASFRPQLWWTAESMRLFDTPNT